jgi:hypothetical protein
MMLRASSETTDQQVDLNAVMIGADANSGVKGGAELTAFAEATITQGDNAITAARERLVKVLGPEATVDAAGVIGNFERMVRIADGTGIPLDTPVALISADMRQEIGIDNFASAKNTPAVTGFKRWAGRILGRMLPLVLYYMRPKKKGETSTP